MQALVVNTSSVLKEEGVKLRALVGSGERRWPLLARLREGLELGSDPVPHHCLSAEQIMSYKASLQRGWFKAKA